MCTGGGSLRRRRPSRRGVWMQVMSPASIFTVSLAAPDQGRPWDVPGKRAGSSYRRSCRHRCRLDLKPT